MARVAPEALDALFREARSCYRWTAQPVGDDALHALYELMRWGPTSANCSPARMLFLRTGDAKQRLRPALSAGNVDKAMSAPVVAVVAHDPAFHDQLPRLYPHADAQAWFAGNPLLAEETAERNSTLQGAYLMLAARAVGLDVGPMSGFDRDRVDAAFMAGRGWRTNFLVCLGHADRTAEHERLPRLAFDEACVLR